MDYKNEYNINTEGNFINVTGNGKVEVQPDISIITLGVSNENRTLEQTQIDNKMIINNIIKMLKEFDVTDELIKTINYTVYPIYDYPDGIRTFKGYNITHIIEVTVNNIEEAGIIIENAINLGANTNLNIRFITSNWNKHYNYALELAVLNGKEKAMNIADVIDVMIKQEPKSVREITSGTYDGLGRGMAYEEGASIQSGLLTVKAVVEEIFEMEL